MLIVRVNFTPRLPSGVSEVSGILVLLEKLHLMTGCQQGISFRQTPPRPPLKLSSTKIQGMDLKMSWELYCSGNWPVSGQIFVSDLFFYLFGDETPLTDLALSIKD